MWLVFRLITAIQSPGFEAVYHLVFSVLEMGKLLISAGLFHLSSPSLSHTWEFKGIV